MQLLRMTSFRPRTLVSLPLWEQHRRQEPRARLWLVSCRQVTSSQPAAALLRLQQQLLQQQAEPKKQHLKLTQHLWQRH
jgi:hypothetical protein